MFHKINHILVVDEEDEFRRSIVRHLRRKGFFIDSAFGDGDSRQKITTSRKNGFPYDLVIRIFLEYHIDNIHFINWIHRCHPQISIFIISGLGDMEWIETILNPKIDICAQKPMAPEELMVIINCLEDKQIANQSTDASEKFSLETSENSCGSLLTKKTTALRDPRLSQVELDVICI